MFQMNNLVPEMLVSHLERSLSFYRDTLGFKVEYQRPEHFFAFLSFNGGQLMLEQDDREESEWRVGPLQAPFGRGMNLSIECPDIRQLAASLKQAGIALRRDIQECWYRHDELLHGELNLLVQDPDGYLLRFTEDLGFKPVEPSAGA
ncbi:glyoxalase [Pseudomonas sp. Os17]|uniref:Bleomycin resistance protein n=1 Tax=Pseudomonas protegens TaxID=380021 RepID=A0A2T6GBV6_9PSED|nr:MULTISPECIES: VOC family protein [Pseudomonas]PUA41638.1 VOC family protein [Pseudomonas protegens]ULT68795.1 VOC family protein [Pseudomonas sp. BC42]BAQ73743.1 glyoxalase [Pseudomonas sp. Os17]